MNILQLTKSLHKGGVEDHILNLSKSLMSMNNTVIVASDNLEEIDTFKNSNIQVEKLKFFSKSLLGFVSNIRNLHKIIIGYSIDIVHCHWRICCLYMKFHNMIYKKKVHYIWTCHLAGMNTSYIFRKLPLFDKYIIGCSSDCSNMVINKYHISPDRVKTIYNGIKLLADTDIIHLNDDKFRITILSRLNPIKNHACMIRALGILVNEYKCKNIVLQITGDANIEYKERLKKLCLDLSVLENVEFCGVVSPYTILAKTDVMVLPSNKEGFPISVLEAFNMKVPVVRTRTGGYTDVKEYCLSFDFDDEKQLAEIIYRIICGEINTAGLTERAKSFLEEKCSLDIMSSEIFQIYDMAIRES